MFTVNTFYRLAVWLPMLFPALAVLFVHGLGFRPTDGGKKLVQILLMMFLYGGIPYTALALWGTFWIGRRPEREIIRMALRAPFLMIAAFIVLATYVLVRSREVGMFLAFSALGAGASLVIGYFFVGLVFLARLVCAGIGLLPPMPSDISSESSP